MLRVRGLTQDDAHIFCTGDQVEQEFRATIELTKFVLESVGLSDYRVQLSLRDPKSDKYVGTEANWNRAEDALRGVLNDSGLDFNEQPVKLRSMVPRLTSWSETASVDHGNWAPCSWTTTCLNGSS